jgi:hypothetical protein
MLSLGVILTAMSIDRKVEALIDDGHAALAALTTADNSVAGLVTRIGALRYAEGTLVGFLDALILTDPAAASVAKLRIERFIGEAIAARLLLD